MLYTVSSERFTACVVVLGSKIIYAASALKWVTGKNFDYFEEFCKRQGWTVWLVAPSARMM